MATYLTAGGIVLGGGTLATGIFFIIKDGFDKYSKEDWRAWAVGGFISLALTLTCLLIALVIVGGKYAKSIISSKLQKIRKK